MYIIILDTLVSRFDDLRVSYAIANDEYTIPSADGNRSTSENSLNKLFCRSNCREREKRDHVAVHYNIYNSVVRSCGIQHNITYTGVNVLWILENVFKKLINRIHRKLKYSETPNCTVRQNVLEREPQKKQKLSVCEQQFQNKPFLQFFFFLFKYIDNYRYFA